MSCRKNDTAAVEITALAAGAGPPANKIATRRMAVSVFGGRESVMAGSFRAPRQRPLLGQAAALDEAAANAMTDSIYNSLVGAFNEDRDMITAQHKNILLNPTEKMMPLAMDSALVQFRKLVESVA